MPYARIIENVQTKRIIFGKALRIRVKKFKQNLPENYSKSTTACKFSKFFWISMPPDPLELFVFLNQCAKYKNFTGGGLQFCLNSKPKQQDKCCKNGIYYGIDCLWGNAVA